MKKAFLVLFVALLFPVSSQAAKPIPPLKETASYKNLRTYVTTLEGISEATTEEKTTYTSTLAARVQAAEAQVVVLFDRREARLNSNYKKLLDKRYSQIDSRAVSRARAARRESSGESQQALRRFRKQRSDVQTTYARKLRPLKNRISQLQKQIDGSSDPREQALLQEEVNLLQGKINRIRAIIRTEIDEARVVYERDLRQISIALKNRLKAIDRQKNVERKEARIAWKSEKKEAESALRNKRRIENALVRELRLRGEESIDAMTIVQG